MLTHARTWPFFATAHAAAALGWYMGWCGGIPLILSMALHSAVLAWGSFTPGAGFFIAHRSTGEPGTLALTFDDGPHPEHTPRLLDLLRDEQVRATFFCIGRSVMRDPTTAQRIVREGHAIGIHTMRHRWYWGFMSTSGATSEIERCAETIEQATGVRPTLFRPPFGVTSPNTARAMRRTGVQPVAWDLRTFDTGSRNADHLIERTLDRLDGATVVVMHDTMPSVVDHVRAVIARGKAKGRRFVHLNSFLVLITGLSIMAHQARAQDPSFPIGQDDPLVRALIEKSRTTTTLQASFVQEKHVKVLREPLLSQGRFFYQQPARLRWQVDGPRAMTAVVDSKDVRMMEAGKERAVTAQERQVYSAINDLINGIVSGRLLSSGSMKAGYSRTSEGLVVDLVPTDARIAKRLKAMRLLFNAQDLLLRELRMDQANGDHTITRFSEARSGGTLPTNVFNLP